MQNDILFFDEISKNSIELVGGKALNLGKLIQQKFPVPNGFCITTQTFNKFISFLYREDIFKKLINTNLENLKEIESLSRQIREMIISTPIPHNLEENIIKSISKIDPQGCYAIRSSSTAEDLHNMSFAGQQDTYLNIYGIDNIITHIKLCFASLYTQRAVVYRKHNKLDERNISMAVIVQQIVDSKKSGIMFTANPLNNNYNQVIIDAGYGLGESLVDGIIVPDSYKYNKNKNKIFEININKKDVAIYRNEDGGTYTIDLDDKMKTKQVLSKKEIKKLIKLGIEIEKYYDYPQDIEWAIDNKNDIYILQSRPITSLYPKIQDTNEKQEKIYISLSHLQVMTDPIKPLGIDIIKRIVPYKQDKSMYKSSAVKESGGRVYLDLTEVYSLPMRTKIAEKSTKDLDYLMYKGVESYIKGKKLGQRMPSLSLTSEVINISTAIIKESIKNTSTTVNLNAVDDLNLFINNFINSLIESIEEKDCLIEKIEVIKAHAPCLILEMIKKESIYRFAASNSYNYIVKLLQKNNIDTTLVNKLISGARGNVTTEMGLKVGDLSDLVRGKDDIIKILKSKPSKAHIYILKKNYTELNECLTTFINEYGMRGTGEVDITSPRYKEDFTTISTSILNNINILDEKEHRENYNNLVKESKECERKILSLVRLKTNKSVNKVKKHIDIIRSYMPLSEHGKYIIVRTFDVYKQVINQCSQQLLYDRVIKNSEDIDYLTLDEIILGLSNKNSYNDIVSKRKEEYKLYFDMKPPRVLDNNGQIYSGSYTKDNMPEDAIPAISVSAGVYEGYARVILDPTKESLQKGEILVTRFTDPGWTPIFINAKGLILEVGGLMTHGATVAREYGIPALVGLDNATSIIKTGDYIRIDADRGYIQIL